MALAVPGYTLAAAGAVVTLRRWMPGFAAAAVCGLALIATLPDLAWGVGGKVVAVRYPPGWAAAAAAINADPRPVAVLPAGSMRQFSWAGDAPVLDPLPRWVRADVFTTGDLTISGRLVPGEGGRARDVERLLATGADHDALARAGVGWLVVESGDDVTVTRIGGDHPAASHRGLMLLTHGVWLAMLVGGGAIALVGRLRQTGGVADYASDPFHSGRRMSCRHDIIPSVFEADLPTVDYEAASTPDEAHRNLRKALEQGPIAMGAHGPEILSYELVRATLRDPRFQVPRGLGLETQGITSGPLWQRAAPACWR